MHTMTRLTLFTRAFYHTCVKNLLKGPDIYIYIYIYQLCMPLYENVKLQFSQKDIFLFKITYISVLLKNLLIYIRT